MKPSLQRTTGHCTLASNCCWPPALRLPVWFSKHSAERGERWSAFPDYQPHGSQPPRPAGHGLCALGRCVGTRLRLQQLLAPLLDAVAGLLQALGGAQHAVALARIAGRPVVAQAELRARGRAARVGGGRLARALAQLGHVRSVLAHLCVRTPGRPLRVNRTAARGLP